MKRSSGITVIGNILYKNTQILAYADDLDIIGRTKEDAKKAFLILKKVTNKIRLYINAEKTSRSGMAQD